MMAGFATANIYGHSPTMTISIFLDKVVAVIQHLIIQDIW